MLVVSSFNTEPGYRFQNQPASHSLDASSKVSVLLKASARREVNPALSFVLLFSIPQKVTRIPLFLKL